MPGCDRKRKRKNDLECVTHVAWNGLAELVDARQPRKALPVSPAHVCPYAIYHLNPENTMDSKPTQLNDEELNSVAAAEMMPEKIRGSYAVLFGTGIGAIVYTIQAEIQEPGGAKKLTDAIYNNGEDFVLRMPKTGDRF